MAIRAKPCDLFALWQSSGVGRTALHQSSAKAAQVAAPAYVYLFAWNTPILDGRVRSFHCAELPFVVDNTDRCDTATGGGNDTGRPVLATATLSDAGHQGHESSQIESMGQGGRVPQMRAGGESAAAGPAAHK